VTSSLATLHAREEARFVESHPGSRERAATASAHWLGGVPMNWMARWPGRFPVFAARAQGARLVDVDGNEYVDLCPGDTGAMTRPAPAFPVRPDAAPDRA